MYLLYYLLKKDKKGNLKKGRKNKKCSHFRPMKAIEEIGSREKRDKI